MKVVLSSLFIGNDLSLIRFATLYAQSIVMPSVGSGRIRKTGEIETSEGPRETGVLKELYHTCPEAIRAEIEQLVSELIVEIDEGSDSSIGEEGFFDAFDTVADLYLDPPNEAGARFSKSDELEMVGRGHSPCLDSEEAADDSTLGEYATIKFLYSLHAHAAFVSAVSRRGIFLTDSEVLTSLIDRYTSRNVPGRYSLAGNVAARLAKRVLEEYLPGVADAPIEDILEVRSKMGDELTAFRHAMSRFSSTIATIGAPAPPDSVIDEVIQSQVHPAVHDLTRALRSSKHRLIQRVLTDVQNPQSYVPLVGSLISGIAPSIAAGASAGLVAFKAIHETWMENARLKQQSGLALLVRPRGPAQQWGQ